jgi:arsenate reductase-like glutaredoxin family protein
MNKNTKNNRCKNAGKWLFEHLICPVIVGLLVWFITSDKINKLENNIQIQNSVIQNNKTEIQKLEDKIILLNNTILQQNTEINNIKSYIEINNGPITIN